MDLIFASGNANKVKELQHVLGSAYTLKSLKDIGCTTDIPENEPTLEGNALAKAQYVQQHFGLDCFADDTGLEVEALDGAPGVLSARYAGESKKATDNINKLLNELQGKTNRKARFRTVIALIMENETHFFEGIVDGQIITEQQGNEGFGYDPVFLPNGHRKSFAEMTLDEKNQISHRARAVAKLQQFLAQKAAKL